MAARMGIICPMVNTKAEAQALAAVPVSAAGKRSNGPIRAAMYGEASNYQKTANDEVLVIPMIETQEGIDNIDAILTCPASAASISGRATWALRLADPDHGSRRAADPGHLREAAGLTSKARQVRRAAQRHVRPMRRG